MSHNTAGGERLPTSFQQENLDHIAYDACQSCQPIVWTSTAILARPETPILPVCRHGELSGCAVLTLCLDRRQAEMTCS